MIIFTVHGTNNSRQYLVQVLNAEFHENPFTGNLLITRDHINRRDKLTGAFLQILCEKANNE
jgi:hypothetical protein